MEQGRGWVFGVLTLTVMLVSAVTVEAKGKVVVEQGGIGRWAGAGTESCGMDGRTYAAIEESCYFPVDLKRRPGLVEIARWVDGGPIETAWLEVVEKEYPLQEIEIDDKFVHLSDEDLSRLWGEQAAVKPLFKRRGGAARFRLPVDQPLAPPVPEGKYFGFRRTFNGEPKNPHTGSDYPVGMGTAVKSVADGKVVLLGDHFFAGKSVYVNHGDGLVSMYFHLSEFLVETGQDVTRGEDLAKVGSTGRSTGPHLHLGFRWHGARVDPQLLVVDPASLPAVAE